MVAAIIIAFIVIVVYYIYSNLSDKYSYWKKRGVVGPKPHLLYGNIRTILGTGEENVNILTDRLYHEYPDEKVIGIYQGTRPTLIIRDPEMMKTVLIRDFSSFVNRGFGIRGNEPVNRNLFRSEAEEWKTLRKRLTPVFTTGKLKNMMPLLNNCVEEYIEWLDKIVEEDGLRELRQLKMKYTTKTISSTAFGIEVDAFQDEPTQFEEMAKNFLRSSSFQKIPLIIYNICPALLKVLPFSVIDPEITRFFLQIVSEIIQAREGKPKVRKDFMDLLIELKEQGTVTRVSDDELVELEMTHEVITAQAMIFYVAGFETSSGAMSFLMYELAKNPDIQAKCQEEVDRVMQKYNGKLDYDALKELEYVSMALDEALRKYPVVAALFRQCMNDYTFKDINVSIEKDTKILIPVQSMHMDPKYFPNPEKFDPERFSPKNKDRVNDYYMPFGDGPRNCIGLRFARVQSLLGIAHFLHKFRVTPSAKTPQKLTYDPTQVTLASVDGIWLNVEKRKVL